ncbi:hypothetical protein EYF80_014468 [Liparis tanakae]|uniref:Uncharacterized protein n=1 Tax=Liparis tanakae TaxID=230148 RepID=A0A4Z2IBZ6_9TELE|nr:hypothetical protein EYF80_014468 [Liparis tanakae]
MRATGGASSADYFTVEPEFGVGCEDADSLSLGGQRRLLRSRGVNRKGADFRASPGHTTGNRHDPCTLLNPAGHIRFQLLPLSGTTAPCAQTPRHEGSVLLQAATPMNTHQVHTVNSPLTTYQQLLSKITTVHLQYQLYKLDIGPSPVGVAMRLYLLLEDSLLLLQSDVVIMLDRDHDESGRSQETSPLRLSSAIFELSLWAKTMVRGMHSSVSSVA